MIMAGNSKRARLLPRLYKLSNVTRRAPLWVDTGSAGRACRVAGCRQARADQLLGGIDGEPEAVVKIKRGGPYKASISLNSPVFAYALGQHAADWLEGRSISQAMDILPSALSTSNLAQYEADLSDPAAVWRDATRRNAYLRMYGNICHDTRDQYLNFPWSSERRPTEPVR
jgi:ribose transport system substrate-binding protein